jgi:DNA invertase Pin-like site-specific DNA recombinase
MCWTLWRKRGAGFRSQADPIVDTTSPHRKLILAVLAALAEFERSMILARTGEGRQRAKARGVRFGRKPKLTPHQIAEALARREAGEALVDIARTFAVSHSTISRFWGKPPPRHARCDKIGSMLLKGEASNGSTG